MADAATTLNSTAKDPQPQVDPNAPGWVKKAFNGAVYYGGGWAKIWAFGASIWWIGKWSKWGINKIRGVDTLTSI